jgi:hypothetical protein
MTKIRALTLGLFCVVVLATNLMGVVTASPPAVVVGACYTQYPPPLHYPTIQAGVTNVASGGTVYVCPGIYPEQVHINQPLYIVGVQVSTADSVVITPPSPMIANTDDFTNPIAAQLWVDAATGVTIANLTVDGNNNGLPAGGPANLVGVYYRNASGTASYVNAINQNQGPYTSSSLGFGILVASGGGGSSTVTVKNSYVANYSKNGIVARYAGTTATFTINRVFGQGPLAGDAENGIEFAYGATGTATFNTVMNNWYLPRGTSAGSGIIVYDSKNVTSNNNVIGNNQYGITYTSATSGGADNGTINSNNVYATQWLDGIDVCSNNNTVKSNTVIGSDESAIHLDASCGSTGNGNTVASNVMSAACAGILQDPGTSGNGVFTSNFFNTVTNTVLNAATCGPPLSPVNGKQYDKVSP